MTEDIGGPAGALGLGLRPKNVGQRVKRVEDPRLLTGQASFTDDRPVAGALHLAFRRSDHAHARILRIDLATAKAMPGVFAVYAAPDLQDFVTEVRAVSRMKDYYATPIFPLARDKVRFVGEPVVAVLAESRYLAEDALEAVEIDYAPLDPLTEQIGLNEFSLIGTGVAVQTALWVAVQQPEAVATLILEAPGSGPDNGLGRHLPQLATPCLLICGTHDRLIPSETGRSYMRLLPNAHLAFVYAAAQAISAERPEAYAELVADFVDRKEAFVINRMPSLIYP